MNFIFLAYFMDLLRMPFTPAMVLRLYPRLNRSSMSACTEAVWSADMGYLPMAGTIWFFIFLR